MKNRIVKKHDKDLLCGNCGMNFGEHIGKKCPRWGLRWSPKIKLIIFGRVLDPSRLRPGMFVSVWERNLPQSRK